MRKKAKISQLKSFSVAFRGIWYLFYNERNFRFHLFVSIVAISFCWFFHVTKTEWIAVLILIGCVLSMEALNTSIEYICDLVSPEYHPLVKKTKDIAAAAVLMAAIIAVIIGLIIFVPYMLDYLRNFKA